MTGLRPTRSDSFADGIVESSVSNATVPEVTGIQNPSSLTAMCSERSMNQM